MIFTVDILLNLKSNMQNSRNSFFQIIISLENIIVQIKNSECTVTFLNNNFFVLNKYFNTSDTRISFYQEIIILLNLNINKSIIEEIQLQF